MSTPRDDNRVPSLLGVSSIDYTTPVSVAANPTTHALLIDGASIYSSLDNRYLQTVTAPLTLPALSAGQYLTNNGTTLSWATIPTPDLSAYTLLTDTTHFLRIDGTNKLLVDVLHTNSYNLTIAGSGTLSGNNSGDQTLSGLGGVPTTRTITEGNGLAGNTYDLSANRTLAMGTPSTLTATTTNALTATSHTHAVTGFAPSVIENTRSNILALTPTAGQLAFSTDTNEYYVADGTNWRVVSLPLGTVSTGADMGAIPFEETWGYGQQDLSNKSLSTVTMKGYNNTLKPLLGGEFQYDNASDKLQLYSRVALAWLNIITLTNSQVQDWMLRSNWNTLSAEPAVSSDTLNRTTMTLGFVDIGAFQTDLILDGGQLI